MTVLEALTSMAPFAGDNTLAKGLVDNDLTSTDEYVKTTHQKSVDLAAADVYDILSTVPDWKESKYSEQYSNAKLRKMADDIRAKYGIRRKTARSSINGVARW